jgi:NodT family efflux transporter outer membrane factor (OMF) lipoprotein
MSKYIRFLESARARVDRKGKKTLWRLLPLFGLPWLLCGCTSVSSWWQNGLKVGPNYQEPPASVAKKWIDSDDQRVRSESADYSEWWTVFDDAVLTGLEKEAYQQNIPLRVAGERVLEARAQRGIACGDLFPQRQQFFADNTRNEISLNGNNPFKVEPRNRFYSVFHEGFNLSWELDLWGRLRRALESADADLDASVDSYDDVLVTLMADVATTYVQIRTLQQRLELLRANVREQEKVVLILAERFAAKVPNSEIDYPQLKSNLELTQAGVPALETELRQANNQLCILLGIAPEQLAAKLGSGSIPKVKGNDPETVVVGIPGELLLRRPDVRKAEREVASQNAQIGSATAELYPTIALTGVIGLRSNEFNTLFENQSWQGGIGPSVTWNILNYGRLLNNIRVQDARYEEKVGIYQQTALKANQEAENAINAFLLSHSSYIYLRKSAVDISEANRVLSEKNKVGTINFNQLYNVLKLKTEAQDRAALAEGAIALDLISLYRALGGGWQVHSANNCPTATSPPIVHEDN